MNQVTVLSKLLHLSEKLIQDCNLDHFPSSSQGETELATLKKLKLPHSGRKMLVVLQEKGETNQRTLATLVGISPQATSESVKKLEEAGCITKTSGKQKNENMISLTPFGEDMADLLQDVITRHAEELFQSFSVEEVTQLGTLLDKFLQDFKKPNT